MENELCELIRKRKKLIQVHEENNMTEGIHTLLTDLYPDSAHFIYELLQNAEDMMATRVNFTLQSDGILFEHNGTKRAFNIHDIDAITNIGHNIQKKDDPTSIGKFGVGFKAVYAYTTTPEIHSGKYHFKINDYFLPVFDDVENINTVDDNGTEWTKFYLPFNHPNKSPEAAFNETLNGLKQLNDSSILFLEHIKRIEYSVSNNKYGYVKCRETYESSNRVEIVFMNSDMIRESKSEWLRFIDTIDFTDDKGKKKHLTIGAAFSLRTINDKTTIIPIKGNTFIYFPAEKEYSGLRFHINAPFASTVARDSVRDCYDNYNLMEEVAKLIQRSIRTIKDQGLIDKSFLETLPNDSDSLSKLYQIICDYVCNTFNKNEYLPARGGGFVSAKKAIFGEEIISDTFNHNLLKSFLGFDKRWIGFNIKEHDNLYHFLISLGIEELSYQAFADKFICKDPSIIEHFIKMQNFEWLKRFYRLCAEVEANSYTKNDSYLSNESKFVSVLKTIKFIYGTDEKLHKAKDVFILPSNSKLLQGMNTPIVHR